MTTGDDRATKDDRWNGLLVKIEEILPIKQHYTWEMKKLLLCCAVNEHPHLASVDKLDHIRSCKDKPQCSLMLIL